MIIAPALLAAQASDFFRRETGCAENASSWRRNPKVAGRV
jgi:hypothetical protein